MRISHPVVVAGVAALVLGLSGAASAQNSNIHAITVALPGGGAAEIRYTGDVPPRVVVADRPAAIDALAPLPSLFGAGSLFAMLEQISAEMDRQAAAMFRQAAALEAQARSGQVTEAAMQRLPPGSQSYSFVSTLSRSGVCTQSVEITSQGDGQPPRIVRHSSGNCGPTSGLPGDGGTVNLPAANPRSSGNLIETRAAPQHRATPAQSDVILTGANGGRPYAGLVREIPPAQR